MQTKLCFNGGEFSPEMAMRSDLEQFYKGTAKMENWELSQMGGIKRRKGFRRLGKAINEESRLIPYIYTYADVKGARYLFEVTYRHIRIRDEQGNTVTTFSSGSAVDSLSNSKITFDFSEGFSYKQIYAMMILTSSNNPPLVVERLESGDWEIRVWQFKHNPWRYSGIREYPILVARDGSNYSVSFAEVDDGMESKMPRHHSDHLRASFWLEQQEAKAKASDVLRGVIVYNENTFDSAEVSDKIAVTAFDSLEYHVALADWTLESNYVDSLDHPHNYPNAFATAENVDSTEDLQVAYSVRDIANANNGTIPKGTIFGIRSEYWEYYTCIKKFAGFSGVSTKLSDYPSYFVRGLAIGDAVTSQGEWSFECSGVWFGSYEVRRNYETSQINEDWEHRGSSWSRISNASNTIISGTEADEECYLRLFITRSKKMTDELVEETVNLTQGFPPDSCGNRLVVQGYKHSLVLKATPTSTGKTVWTSNDKIQLYWYDTRKVVDWSWRSFSERYGYPLLCEAHNLRLVFASTITQPQTLWFSRTDDLDNFMVTDTDTSAMSLSLAVESQNPVCWMLSRDDSLLLGTSDAEYVLTAGRSQSGINNNNANVENHGFTGSAAIRACRISDRIVYVERGASRVRDYGYSLEADGYRSTDLNIFAPHILKDGGGVKEMSFIRKPDTVLLATLNNGELALCVYNNLQQVKGWHRWTTNGKILSACPLPDGNNDDKIFFIVKREQKTSSGVVTSSEVTLEVIDSKSNYTDNGKDYTSLVETFALADYQRELAQKNPTNTVSFYFAEEVAVSNNFRISYDRGDTWYKEDKARKSLPKGWVKFIGVGKWKDDKVVSFKANGNMACHILALQG